jgi:hypothetical protein
MLKSLFFLLFSLIIVQSVLPQDEKKVSPGILFRGVVIDADVMSVLSGTNILINKTHSAISESDGSFSLTVKRGDTVSFRRIGYKTTVMSISDTLSGHEYIAGIYMHSDTLSIGEVIILPGLGNLKNELLNAETKVSTELENARNNVALAAYQGKNNQVKLGDPDANYSMLRQRQKVDAYEKGGIPSDRIAAVSPLMLIPAANLLINGLPRNPAGFKRHITDDELDAIKQMYLENMRQRK